jgi:DNA-binding FrmR family transcriptional regulator
MKAVVRGKVIALSASKKKLKRAYTIILTAHLKALEQNEANTPKRSRLQEIIKWNKNKKNYTKNQQNQELVL